MLGWGWKVTANGPRVSSGVMRMFWNFTVVMDRHIVNVFYHNKKYEY